MTDIHAPVPGNAPLCEFYLLMQRDIIEAQANLILALQAVVGPQGSLIADLQRRLAGEPITRVFLDDAARVPDKESQ